MTIQNEFFLLVNAYYQADAISKKILAKNEIQQELEIFRQDLMQKSEMFGQAILLCDAKGETGVFEKDLIRLKLNELYKVNDAFFLEIENSISQVKKKNGNMISYRISFQKASSKICEIVGGMLPNLDEKHTLETGVYLLIDEIMQKNYWQGDEVIQMINLARSLKSNLNYSDNWIKEYITLMFATFSTQGLLNFEMQTDSIMINQNDRKLKQEFGKVPNRYMVYDFKESHIIETGQKILIVRLSPLESTTYHNGECSEAYNSLDSKIYLFDLDSVEAKIILESIQNSNIVDLEINEEEIICEELGTNFLGMNINHYYHNSVILPSHLFR